MFTKRLQFKTSFFLSATLFVLTFAELIFLLRELDEDRVFPDAFDPAPRDHDIAFSSESEKACVFRHDERADMSVRNVEFKITCVSESCAVAKIDDFLLTQIIGTDLLHNKTSVASVKTVCKPFYA